MDVLVDGEIVLFGTVGEDLFEDGFTAMDVVKALAKVGRSKPVTVRMNSGGGYAEEGVAIYNALNAHKGKVTVIVEAVAASAASIIAMGGDEIIMRTGATMMVHDPAALTMGNSEDHAKSIEMLETLAVSMAEVYAERTERSVAEIRSEMKDELWMAARDAVAKGYADKVDKGKSKRPTAFDYRLYQHAPERMVAMAVEHDWKLEEPAEVAATNRQTQETSMTEAEKAAAAEAEKKRLADEATAKAAAEAKAKAEADAAAAAAAAPPVSTKTETVEQITARVTAELTKRHADIMAACDLVGSKKATAFIAEGKTLGEVIAALQAERSAGNSEEISSRHNMTPRSGAPAASWEKHIARANATVPNGRTG